MVYLLIASIAINVALAYALSRMFFSVAGDIADLKVRVLLQLDEIEERCDDMVAAREPECAMTYENQDDLVCSCTSCTHNRLQAAAFGLRDQKGRAP